MLAKLADGPRLFCLWFWMSKLNEILMDLVNAILKSGSYSENFVLHQSDSKLYVKKCLYIYSIRNSCWTWLLRSKLMAIVRKYNIKFLNILIWALTRPTFIFQRVFIPRSCFGSVGFIAYSNEWDWREKNHVYSH